MFSGERFAEAGIDLDVVRGTSVRRMRLLFESALPDQTFADAEIGWTMRLRSLKA